MGKKLAADVVWNCFINNKGNIVFSSRFHWILKMSLINTFLSAGEAHTNLPADLEMEHANREAQLDIEAAKGSCLSSEITVLYTKVYREYQGTFRRR